MRAGVLLVACALGCSPEKSPEPPKPKAAATKAAETTRTALTLAPGKKEVRLLFAGDASFARRIERGIAKSGGGRSAWALEKIAPALGAADLAFLNLECVFTKSTEDKADKTWVLRAAPKHLPALAAAGIDVVSFANNHALDFGQRGIRDTLEGLKKAGVAVSGVKHKKRRRQAPLVARVGDTTFGFLSYSDISFGAKHDFYPRPFRLHSKRSLRDVEAAREQVDVVVVSVHWGSEYSMTPNARQQQVGRALVDAGADLVVGHHPHVPQPVEAYKGGLIAWSLGNFLFDLFSKFKVSRTRRGFMLEVRYAAGKRTGFDLVPINAGDDYRPFPDSSVDTKSWIRTPRDTPFAFSDHVPELEVTRTYPSGPVRCAEWSKKRPKAFNQYLQWLRPRWVCPSDVKAPWTTVARTGERSGGVFREGVWAQPHEGGPLVLRAPEVPLGAKLRGHAGINDHGLHLGAKRPPITVRVEVEGGPSGAFVVPVAKGWIPIELATPGLAGHKRPVSVIVESESGSQSALVVDVWVER